MYALSKPAPNWQTMNPYSSLEHIGSDSNIAQPTTTKDSSSLSYRIHPKHYVCDNKNNGETATHKSTCKSKCNICYVYDDTASTSNSDYDSKAKQKHVPNIGLKAPSNSRLHAQAIIHEAKAKSTAAKSSGVDTLMLPFDEERNKKYYYCPNTFYYSASLKTHIEHAYQDIVNVKGINNPGMPASAMMGINIPASPSTVLGTNNSTALKPVPSTSANNNAIMTSKPQAALSSSTNELSTKDPSCLDTTGMHYKCKPKPHGKHYRPIPSDPVSKKGPVDSSKSSKPHFITVTHSLKKAKRCRIFHCKDCLHVTDSQASANKHYKESHSPVKCSQCDTSFNNQSSLCHHKYQHIEKKFHCRNCDKVFLFESDLAGHRLKHHRHPGFQCNHKKNGSICGKWYFAKSDLAKHARMHSGKVYSCYECEYTTVDICYLRAHRFTHSKQLKYKCNNCDELFKHHTQLCGHEEKCKSMTNV